MHNQKGQSFAMIRHAREGRINLPSQSTLKNAVAGYAPLWRLRDDPWQLTRDSGRQLATELTKEKKKKDEERKKWSKLAYEYINGNVIK